MISREKNQILWKKKMPTQKIIFVMKQCIAMQDVMKLMHMQHKEVTGTTFMVKFYIPSHVTSVIITDLMSISRHSAWLFLDVPCCSLIVLKFHLLDIKNDPYSLIISYWMLLWCLMPYHHWIFFLVFFSKVTTCVVIYHQRL